MAAVLVVGAAGWYLAGGWITRLVRPSGEDAIEIPDVGLTLRQIPLGSFEMGTRDGFAKDERPVTTVTFSRPFWLGRTEVTQRQWEALMGPGNFGTKGAELPVTQVAWYAAVEYCRRLTERERMAGRLPAGYVYSLPTEAMWEYAAREWHQEDVHRNLPAVAWIARNSGGALHPVGLKKPNRWGLHDMLGNAGEMCLDDRAAYPGGQLVDPPAVVQGRDLEEGVLRGGTYEASEENCRPATRLVLLKTLATTYGGFRVALIPEDLTRREPAAPPASL